MLMRTPLRWVRPKRLQPPGFLVPCQPTLAHKVPAGDGWIHELKHDGFRILAFKDGDAVRLWSRNGRDWSAEFVAITEAMRGLPFKRIMLDGEAVAHCLEGLPHFHKLLGDGQASACFYAFDLLWLEAQDVRSVELIGRRRMLQKVLKKVGPVLRFSEHLSARAGRGNVPPRLRHGAGGHRLEEADQPLQVRRVQELAEAQEPGIPAALMAWACQRP
jgi:bifunctional non-homologous end joining protein LigD